MVPAGNKAKRLSSVNHITKTVHHYLYQKRFFITLENLPPKKHNGLFKMKLDIWTNSAMLNSMMMFTFYVLDQKYPFWANFLQKSKLPV